MTPVALLAPTPIEAATRREFITGVGAAALAAAFLAACGDDDAGATPTPSPTSAASRIIEHQHGSTEVSGIPARIVSVGWTEQDALLALGIVPVGTTAWVGEAPGAIHPWAQDELGDTELPEVLDDTDGIQFERIAALRPDLILALYVPMGLTREDYDRLAQIAPTIAPPADTTEGGISWQDLTRTVGIAVGKPDAAEQVVADVEAKFAEARAAHPAFIGATGLNAYPAGDGTFQAYPPPDPGGRLLTDLGFRVPEPIIELAAGAAWVTISGERVDLFETDVLVWLVEDYSVRDRLRANPLYAQLRAAREGRDIFLAYAEDADVAAATSMQTALSLPFLLDALVPMLAAAIDGDPATEA